MISNTSIAEKPAMGTTFLRPKSQREAVDTAMHLPLGKRMPELFNIPDLVAPPEATRVVASENKDTAPPWKRALDLIESKSCWLALGANFLGALMMKMGFSETVQKRIESVVSTVLKMSFLPYGLSGIANGYVCKNIFTMLGFSGELIFPWLGNLKNIYLIRGLPTGIDQLWTATDHHVSYKDGIFPDFKTGFFEVTKALGKLTKEIFTEPVKSFLTLKTKGHHAFLSSVGSATATIGFGLTGMDKVFGWLRDLSGPIFDWGMVLEESLMKKVSGGFFMLESIFDGLARYATKANHNKLALNMLAHGCGRLALMLYKNSSSVATVKI